MFAFRVYDNIGTRNGFVGCVKYLRIIRHQVTKKLGRPDSLVVSIENVRECESSPCLSAPCRNGATCRPAGGAPPHYTCTCPVGFQGANCDERLDPCESNPCGYDEGLLCDVGPEGGHVCRCLFGGDPDSNGNTCNNGNFGFDCFVNFLDIEFLILELFFRCKYRTGDMVPSVQWHELRRAAAPRRVGEGVPNRNLVFNEPILWNAPLHRPVQ